MRLESQVGENQKCLRLGEYGFFNGPRLLVDVSVMSSRAPVVADVWEGGVG